MNVTPRVMIDFHSTDLSPKELKRIIRELVRENLPNDEVKSIDIDFDGIVKIETKNGEKIEIEIDWEEIKLRQSK